MDVHSTLTIFAMSCRATLAWCVIFAMVRNILPYRSIDFQNRCVSLLHAVEAIVFCCMVVRDWHHPLGSVGQATNTQEWWCLLVSLGYFVYDMFYCLLIEKSIPNALHHLGTLLGLVVGVFAHQSGPELVLCLLLAELSNPFMHLRAMFKELGLKDTPIALGNEVLFAASFALCRIALGPFLTYAAVTTPTSSIVVKVGAMAIQVISVFWFWKILQVVWRRLGGTGPSPKTAGKSS